MEEYYNIEKEHSSTPVSQIVTSKFSSITDSSKASGGSGGGETSQEAIRLRRVRVYFFLSIFGLVCGASAVDASQTVKKGLSRSQRYMI